MAWNSYNGPTLTLTPGLFSVQVAGQDSPNGNSPAQAYIQRTTDNGAEPTHTTHTGESVAITGSLYEYTVDLGSEIYPGTSSPLLHIVTDAGSVDAGTNWGTIYGSGNGVTVDGNCDFISGICTLTITGGVPQSCTADYVSVAETATWEDVTVMPFTGINFSYTDSELSGVTTYWYRVRNQQRGLETDPWTAARWSRAQAVPTGSGSDPLIGTIYRIYNGSSTARTGTVTINGTTTVVGSGTAFGTEFSVGDVIVVNDELRRIASVTNSTNLTVGVAFAESASGQVYTGYHLVSVTSLASGKMTKPKSTPQTYSAARALLDGSVRGLGWATTEWAWGFLTETQRDALKALCPGKSAFTVIDTLDDAREFHTYSAVMVWPDKPDFYGQKWSNFVLTFRKMVLV